MSDFYTLKSNGGMWGERNATGNQPTWRGNIQITDEQLKKLIEKRKAGEVNNDGCVEMRISAWEKTAQESGNKWYSISAEVTNYKKQEAPEVTLPKEDIPF
jgi:hypothetical protein